MGFEERQNTLTEDEVHARIVAYENESVTDSLIAFGGRLLDANRDRTKHLESKAGLIVGYALALIGVVLFREGDGWSAYVRWAALGCAAFALAQGFLALRVGRYRWLSDSQWFENENGVMESADTLKRCHVLAMHAANRHIGLSNDEKADHIIVAQGAVVLAGVFVAVLAIAR